jgi:hypothetical protein
VHRNVTHRASDRAFASDAIGMEATRVIHIHPAVSISNLYVATIAFATPGFTPKTGALTRDEDTTLTRVPSEEKRNDAACTRRLRDERAS